MVEIRENNNQTQEINETPETITVSMIIEDLEHGIDRTAIKAKYNLETWEVKQMFDHPQLKGKKAKRVKKLSFNFVDDVTMESSNPNQRDLEDQIEEEKIANLHKEDNMHDALLDDAIVKSDPENMNKEELIEHEQEIDENTQDEY